MDSVAKRTRSRQDQMYRKLHEGIKKKNLGSSFTGFRDINNQHFYKPNFKPSNFTIHNQPPTDDDDDDEIEVLVSADFYKKRKNTLPNVDLVSKRKRSQSNQSKTDDDHANYSLDEEEEEEDIRIPLNYTFGVQESPVIQKSEEEKELDSIWDDMNLYLSASDHDPPDSNIEGEIEAKAAGNCIEGGEHLFLLDEEIGLKCKFCSFVDLEIKYYTEPFCKNPFGRSGKQRCYPDQVDIFDGLDHQDLVNDTQKGGNLSSPIEGTVWEIIPGIRKDLHTHQREGFLFLWKNIGGGIDLEKLKQPTGFDSTGGCIISHAPGTGKTRLAIVFLQTYMELYPKCRPIVIAPCSMLNSWEDEFRKWKVKIPFHNLKQTSTSGKRFDKLMSWKRKTSVLGLSYRLFEELVRQDKKNRKGRHKSEDVLVRKILLQFPGLIVLDEGHNPRNDSTLILQALSRIETKKRIILSGTPFQNDFNELFNTLCLARPQFLDSLLKGFRPKCYNHDQMIHAARREWKRITNPIYEESSEGRMKAKSLKNVRDMISPFVHLYKGNILQKTLPGLREAVIKLKPDEFQKGCLDRLEAKKDLFGLNLEIGVSLVSVHPCLMRKKLVEKGEVDKLRGLRLNPDAGVKTKFVIQLIRRSVSLKEKVLVFSQFRDPLELISEQLVAGLNWMVEREILEINGSVNQDERQSRIKCYNDPRSEAKVMLATTRTCSEGINFVGASRVVLVDVVWNPQVERQAISRAYRLGQTKLVYVYHLITCGTMEEEKYCRQAKKGVMSDSVFNSWESDEQCCSSSWSLSDVCDEKKDRILEAMLDSNKLKDAVESIIYQARE